MIDLPLRQVAVQIESDDDGEIGTQGVAESGEDFAVRIGIRLRYHGAMQGQKQTIGPLALQLFDHECGNFIQDRIHNRAGRRGPGHDNRDRFIPLLDNRRNEAGQLVVGIAPFLQHGRTKRETLRQEGGAVSAQGVEGIRFVHEPGNSNPHKMSRREAVNLRFGDGQVLISPRPRFGGEGSGVRGTNHPRQGPSPPTPLPGVPGRGEIICRR